MFRRGLVIGRSQTSSLAVSVLSLGLLVPFGAGAFADRTLALVQAAAAAGVPAKHVTVVVGTHRDDVRTHAPTIEGLLAERGIVRQPGDRVSPDPAAPVVDGSTVVYTAPLNVTVMLDGVARQISTAETTVGTLLGSLQLSIKPRDTVTPAREIPLTPGLTVNITRATSWLERFQTRIAPPVRRRFDISMSPGTRRVVDPGRPGTRETTVAVLQPDLAVAPTRMILAARVLRLPRTRIVAEGVGGRIALGELAARGFLGTLRLADAALKMIATAYTASCSGCSGMTASGHLAGHGVVAVDPHVIPMGSHLFIPGYGHAVAGDTGGSIRGNRIDLGFDTARDALSFGRRPIVVYVLK